MLPQGARDMRRSITKILIKTNSYVIFLAQSILQPTRYPGSPFTLRRGQKLA